MTKEQMIEKLDFVFKQCELLHLNVSTTALKSVIETLKSSRIVPADSVVLTKEQAIVCSSALKLLKIRGEATSREQEVITEIDSQLAAMEAKND